MQCPASDAAAAASDYAGAFETHLTVAAQPGDDFAALQAFATAQALKFLHIALPRGRAPSQPMLSWRGRGGLDQQLQQARQVERQLGGAGFRVVRRKIEAAPQNAGVPQLDQALPPDCYFEAHVKLRLSPDSDLAALIALAQRHEAHVSRNALREYGDRSHERFVTQRCTGAGLRNARRALAALERELAASFELLRSELEFVVHDSNPGLDAGWIREE